MIFSNAKILTDDFVFETGDLQIKGDRITKIGICADAADERVDASGCYLIPGLVETHFHGAWGADTASCDREMFERLAAYEASEGVTSFVPGLASSPNEVTERFLKAGAEYIKNQAPGVSKMLGLYLEGPFLSPDHCGGHVPAYLQAPSLPLLQHWIESAQGNLCKLTVAPETAGALAVIAHAAENGIAAEIGHTGADYETACAAIAAGAHLATHTYNGMAPFTHRNPGVLGAVLTDDRVTCELIADFGHVSPPAVLLAYRAKGRDKINLISDSCMAAGLSDGNYTMPDGRIITVRQGISYLPNGTITGSACSVMTGVRHLVSLGIPLADAVKTASYNPAKTVKKEREIGSLAVGKKADLVLLDRDLRILQTVIDGVAVNQWEWKR